MRTNHAWWCLIKKPDKIAFSLSLDYQILTLNYF
jgi:hypothetical protein